MNKEQASQDTQKEKKEHKNLHFFIVDWMNESSFKMSLKNSLRIKWEDFQKNNNEVQFKSGRQWDKSSEAKYVSRETNEEKSREWKNPKKTFGNKRLHLISLPLFSRRGIKREFRVFTHLRFIPLLCVFARLCTRLYFVCLFLRKWRTLHDNRKLFSWKEDSSR
jgi:hypothetical protein